MKQILIAVATLMCFSMSAAAAGSGDYVDKIVRKYKGLEAVEYVKVSKVMLEMMLEKGLEYDEDAAEWLRGVRRLDVIMIDDDPALEDEFSRDISGLEEKGYSKPLSVSDGGDAIKTYVLKKSGMVKSLVILVKDEDECVFVRMKGRISEKHVKDIVLNVGD